MYVYVITNLINDKIYIGQHSTEDLKWYLKENVGNAMRGSNAKRLLYRSIRKYGASNFFIGPIVKCQSKDELDWWEKFYIKQFNARNTNVGYNLTDGGEGALGLVHSEKSLQRMRESSLERGIGDKCRKAQKEYLKNRVFTATHRKNLSDSRKGMKFTDEHKKNLSLAKSRNKEETKCHFL